MSVRSVAVEVVPPAPKLHVSPLEIARLPLLQFPGRILVISSPEEEKRVEELFNGEALLGFDSESRPSSALAQKNRMALIQIASEKVACLWRLGELRSLPPLLRRLLEDRDVHKVSQGAVHELSALKEQWGINPQSFLDLHHIAMHLRTTPRSLQGLVAIFLQRRLSKDQRLTDWQQSPLTQAQIEYAAVDAWAARQVLIEMRRAFLCSRLECERLLGSPSRLVPNAAGTPVPRSTSDRLSSASQLPKPSEGQTAERGQDEAAPVLQAPPAEAHRELAAFCVTKGYVLRFDGFESLPSGFRCVFRVEFRRNGQVVSEVFRSKRVHAGIRAAQNDAATEALDRKSVV